MRIFAYGFCFGIVMPEQSSIIRNEFKNTMKKSRDRGNDGKGEEIISVT